MGWHPDASGIDTSNFNSHHDMEGSKLHHDVASTGDKKNPDSGSSLDKSLSYFLSSLGSPTDDYYDDVEQQRSKDRGGKDQVYQTADDLAANSIPFDPASLFDTSDDYGDSSSSGLASELANFNKKNGANKNPFLNKVKEKLNSLIPQTISSELLLFM